VLISKILNRKAITRGRTDHFAAGVTHLQFIIQVRFFGHVAENGLPNLIPPKNEHFPPMTCDLQHWPTKLI